MKVKAYLDGEEIELEVEYDKEQGYLFFRWDSGELMIGDVVSIEKLLVG